MREGNILLAGVLIFFIVGSCHQSQILKQKCNTNLLKFFQGSVKFHQNVTKELSVQACLYEFQTYGTCCETESLKEYMIKIVEADALRWGNAIKRTWVFNKEILPNTKKIVEKINALLPAIKEQVNTQKMSKNVLDAAVFLSTNLPKINDTRLLKLENDYKDNVQVCFDSISAYRKSAMCLACSGRGQIFYDGNKMNIKFSNCEAILSECIPAFQYMINVIGTIKALFEVVNGVKREDKFPKYEEKIPFASSLTLTQT